jgi:hypothetical protein
MRVKESLSNVNDFNFIILLFSVKVIVSPAHNVIVPFAIAGVLVKLATGCNSL